MPSSEYRRHFMITEVDQQLPLHIESVGYQAQQPSIMRESGYPYYHWLHTIDGCGEMIVGGGAPFRLPPCHGILLNPHTPHSYCPVSGHWGAWYLTFEGSLAFSLVTAIDVPLMTVINWDADSPLANIHNVFEQKCQYSFYVTGINGSLEVYSFLALLKTYGRSSGQSSLSKDHEKLKPLLVKIEKEFGNSDIGLGWMADIANISPQHINTLFRKVFGISAYQYLLQFRIQKAKEFLLSDPGLTIKYIALSTGFNDSSHFVSYFRKSTGFTPEQFRKRNLHA
ncbi:AraC family transcriptional regulator [Gordoniibacillus kamchatkensis]|nr:helix-turn-helix transcriptional regulator [Paenibacillus sp. VKM B-2647]